MPNKQKTDRTGQFAKRMELLLGNTETQLLMKSIRQISPKSIRFNRKLNSPQEELKGKPVPWCSHYGKYWDGETPPSQTLGYTAGKYYIQEASAMLAISAASHVINFSGKIVLDLTAAPGGKATQTAELIRSGYLTANEVIKKRVAALTWNINRHRLDNVIVTSLPTRILAFALPGFYDVVVVDAPCSGEGLFKKQKHSLENWSEKNVRLCAARQTSILKDAAALLKPGGFLVYSTCTFALEENEDQVEVLLNENFNPVPLPKSLPVSPAVSNNDKVCLCSRRIFPHREGGAGAFVSVIRKKKELLPPASREYRQGLTAHPRLDKKKFPYIRAEQGRGYFYEKNGIISFFPYERIPAFLLENAYQTGAPIIDKHRPHECMFGSIQLPEPEAVIEVDAETAEIYAQGRNFQSAHPDGIYIVSFNRMLLGHVNIHGGIAVNKLPKALRR
ncbi:MAG: hypothetical protein GY950_03310 [bacterium]|nr:hypothetical protein [bacterium]